MRRPRDKLAAWLFGLNFVGLVGAVMAGARSLALGGAIVYELIALILFMIGLGWPVFAEFFDIRREFGGVSEKFFRSRDGIKPKVEIFTNRPERLMKAPRPAPIRIAFLSCVLGAVLLGIGVWKHLL